MAVTTERGTNVKIEEGTLAGYLQPWQSGSRQSIEEIVFTQGAAAGDANSTAALCKMPAGKHKLLEILLVTSAFGAARVLDVGYEAHVKEDGTAVTVAANTFQAVLDVAAAKTTLVGLNRNMDSKAGYVINATVTGGTIPIGATINGWVQYAY